MRIHSQRGHQSSVINIVMRASQSLITRAAIGAGALETLPNLLSQSESGKKVLILTQGALTEAWAEPLRQIISDAGYTVDLLELPDGEQCKQHDILIHVWQRLQELRFTRSDTIVAVGGGSLTDLAGFAAGTYLRGVKLVLVPTTLLAQVDASIGGKTGINLPAGKNLAGSFYFPSAVAVDSEILKTLPDREIRSGLGEIIKYGLMELTITANSDYRSGPRSFFALLEDIIYSNEGFKVDNASIDGIIGASVKMKLAVVAKDPYEGRLRRCLNLGHTLGHAIEKVCGYSLSHGECVAIGLVFACRVALNRNVFDAADFERVVKLVTAAGLPAEIPQGTPSEKLLDAMAFDKKRIGDQIKFVLPIRPLGAVDIDASLSLDELKDLLP